MAALAEYKSNTIAQKIAFFLFCATCVQLVFLKSSVTVVTGVKADFFSSTLCTLTFAVCVAAAEVTALRVTGTEILVSLVLIVWAGIGGVLSATPWNASLWTYVAVASSLAGFWCARIVLNTPYRQRCFVYLCAASLIWYSLLGWWGYFFHARVDYFIDDAHLAVNLLVLLSFSVLSLLTWKRPFMSAIGIGGLGLSYGVLYLCGTIGGADSGVLVPTIMIVMGCFIVAARSGSKAMLFIIVFAATVVSSQYITHVSQKVHSSPLYQAQRLESYSFSLHIAQKHPLFGIGLRAPRVEYLTDYAMRHTYYTKDQFARDVAYFKTLQNTFLTIMVDLGVPFLLLYGTVIVVLLARLAWASTRSAQGHVIPLFALLICLAGGLLHLLVMDLLLMSQIAWFFHVLLGLIPPATEPRAEHEFQPRSVMIAAVTAVAAMGFGIVTGTHRALDPKQLPSYAELSQYVKDVPLVRSFVADKQTLWIGETPDAASGSEQPASGNLVVHIRNYHGVPIDWGVLCIVDNSASMARPAVGWNPHRLRAATEMICDLGTSLPAGSEIAVRSFSDQGPLVRREGELGVRVSRLLHNWTALARNLGKIALDDTLPSSRNNVCAAGAFALERDFQTMRPGLHPRILIMTDGEGECDPRNLSTIMGQRMFGADTAVLDVIAFGMEDAAGKRYATAVHKTRGVLVHVRSAEDRAAALSRYGEALDFPVRKPLGVRGSGRAYELWPEQALEVPAGSYVIALPASSKTRLSRDRIEGVRVTGGSTTILNLEIVNGRLVKAKPDS